MQSWLFASWAVGQLLYSHVIKHLHLHVLYFHRKRTFDYTHAAPNKNNEQYMNVLGAHVVQTTPYSIGGGMAIHVHQIQSI